MDEEKAYGFELYRAERRMEQVYRDIEPCPWCGAMPEETECDALEGIQCKVVCMNPECRVHPYVLGHTWKEAEERWNERACLD